MKHLDVPFACVMCQQKKPLREHRRMNGGIGGARYFAVCKLCYAMLPKAMRDFMHAYPDAVPPSATSGVEFVEQMSELVHSRNPRLSGTGGYPFDSAVNKLIRRLKGEPEEQKASVRLTPEEQRALDVFKNPPPKFVPSPEIAHLFMPVQRCHCCGFTIDVGTDERGVDWCALCAVIAGHYGCCALHHGPVIDPVKAQNAVLFDPDNIDPAVVPVEMQLRFGLRLPDELLKRPLIPPEQKSILEVSDMLNEASIPDWV